MRRLGGFKRRNAGCAWRWVLVTGTGISFPPGCRPAVDETCGRLCWLSAERLAGFLVRASPRISWTRGTRSTPDCAMGRYARERAVETLIQECPAPAAHCMEGVMDVLYPPGAGL